MTSIIAWDSDSTSALISYMGQIFDDFSGLLLLIVSVSLGALVISVVINSLKN